MENLKALVFGKEVTPYQKALAQRELKDIMEKLELFEKAVKNNAVTPKRFNAARAAMQGMLANCNPNMVYSKKPELIKECYEYADELLKQENE